jgi:flavin reductase (DIM6/NTAB) family NADH-FMN oxidoreductase RutF
MIVRAFPERRRGALSARERASEDAPAASAHVAPCATRIQPLQDEFRAAMRELAGAVAVITCGQGAARAGFSATSVSSLSLQPPTLIVCANRASSSWPSLRAATSFGVNVLASSHAGLAQRFAGGAGAEGADRYQEGHWTTFRTGAPLLADALASFDCALEEIIERHTHAIVIGRVEAVRRSSGGGALVYWRGDYEQLGWSPEEIARAVGPTRQR